MASWRVLASSPIQFQMRLLLDGLMIVLAIASFTTSRVFSSTVLSIITGGLLIMVSSTGFSILLAEFYKVFDFPSLWIASPIVLTVVLIPLSFLMLYLELPEIIVKIDRNYRG
ncbi:MAG: hypothetical protein ACO2OS_07950 [Thermosphaera aggregans]|uniref:hypothetical protein n=1 Tax=Thermosphaera aggregans TaxID=54254 RepID=UPI003BFD6B9B